MDQVVKEGYVTNWDVDEHQAALHCDMAFQKSHAFYLTKPEQDENGNIKMMMDGMKYRKKVEGQPLDEEPIHGSGQPM